MGRLHDVGTVEEGERTNARWDSIALSMPIFRGADSFGDPAVLV
jgi:hypothetical protein